MAIDDRTVRQILYGSSWWIVYDKILLISGKTAKEVGEQIGCSPASMTLMKKGARKLSDEKIAKILCFFQIDKDILEKTVDEVIQLLLEGKSENSIEIWHAVINILYQSKGQ